MALDNLDNMSGGMNSPANNVGGANLIQGVGKAMDKFREVRDKFKRDRPKNYNEEVTNQLNVGGFAPDDNDRSPLAAIQRINLDTSNMGIIPDISPTDVNRGGGVKQVGSQSGSVIGNQPIFVQGRSSLPVSLFEKRRAAINAEAARKSKAMGDFLKMPDNVDPMYDRQISDIYARLSDELASIQGIDVTDMSDPRVREFMKKKAAAESAARMFNDETGLSVTAKALVDKVRLGGGEFVMDKKAYQDAISLLNGDLSMEEFINDEDTRKKMIDAYSRLEAESSAVNVFETTIKDNIEKTMKSGSFISAIETDLQQGVITQSTLQVERDRLNSFIDNVAIDQNWSDKRVEQVKKIAQDSFTKQVESKFGTIAKATAQSISDRKKREDEIIPLKAQSQADGGQTFSYNTGGKPEYTDKEFDSEYGIITTKDDKKVIVNTKLFIQGTLGNTTSYTDSQLVTDLAEYVKGTQLPELSNDLTNAQVELNRANNSGTEEEQNKAKTAYDQALDKYVTATNETIDSKFHQRFKDRNFSRISLNEPYIDNPDMLARYNKLTRELGDLDMLIQSGATALVIQEAEAKKQDIVSSLQQIESSKDFYEKGTIIEIPASQVPNLESKLDNLNSRRGYKSKEEFFSNAKKSLSREQFEKLQEVINPAYFEYIMGKKISDDKKKPEPKPEPNENNSVPSGQVDYSKYKRK